MPINCIPSWQEGFPALLAALSQPIWVFDIDHKRVFWANDAALHVWNADSVSELQARDMSIDMSVSVSQRLKQYQQDFERDNARFVESWTLYPNGAPCALKVVFSGMRVDGGMMMLCEAQSRVTADSATLRSAEALMHTSMSIALYDEAGVSLYRNPAARAQVANVTETWREHFIDDSDWQSLRQGVAAVGQARRLAQVHTRNGRRWHEIAARACRDAVSGRDALLVSEVDITDLKHAEARASFLANHDVLTGLPNRNGMRSDFLPHLQRARRAGWQIALMFIDLDRFKNVNDSLGHARGDELLVRMAGRLSQLMGKDERVARLGGDEFLVVMAAPQVQERAEQLGRRILQALSMPMRLGGMDIGVSASVGVSLCLDEELDVEKLMRHADLAMYAAKDAGRNQLSFFNPALEASVQAQLALESDIRRGLEAGEFVAYFQPRVEVASGRIIGAEALARWAHPDKGLLMPGAFIGMCEDSGQILELGRQILAQAARQQRQWQLAGMDLTVSVNLSPCQFADPGLAEMVGQVLRESGCQPERLELEITESVLLGHDERTLAALDGLRQLGIRIAVDDFGTGYSNLAYLQRYPLHSLKIDRSFVASLDSTPAIAELITTMCRMLGLNMVAEGVETRQQLEWLAQRGCQEYQGYLCSPAVSAAQFARLLR
ncbi:bifunctional diguanylate cyclase/phosphodiesterase [Chromobacterium sp. IIBBL 290-4]|uniref:putative bifunctional diguanylate cyclase/phosphodiesterase n=1 Tax=Chromobacterium sp. IIBBL 290-4 TaxID=2953890 RepID=UPI0020B8339F|nr:EAL domain-containing protein [Chromobacterium sp. IIBBL 290-4]UTH72676.1 EAL domain-containing protein [Chromobacterium sp. IIBBL 290-4]